MMQVGVAGGVRVIVGDGLRVGGLGGSGARVAVLTEWGECAVKEDVGMAYRVGMVIDHDATATVEFATERRGQQLAQRGSLHARGP